MFPRVNEVETVILLFQLKPDDQLDQLIQLICFSDMLSSDERTLFTQKLIGTASAYYKTLVSIEVNIFKGLPIANAYWDREKYMAEHLNIAFGEPRDIQIQINNTDYTIIHDCSLDYAVQ